MNVSGYAPASLAIVGAQKGQGLPGSLSGTSNSLAVAPTTAPLATSTVNSSPPELPATQRIEQKPAIEQSQPVSAQPSITSPLQPAATAGRAEQSAVSPANETLDPQQQAIVRELARIDQEVRRHEQAHSAVGGSVAGAPSYSYTRGPDGKLYATGGEVSINTTPASKPQDVVDNARLVLQAALAPANPSVQDLRVAAQARAELIAAQAEIARTELAQQRPEGAVESLPSDEQVLNPAVESVEEGEQTASPLAQDTESEFQQNLDELAARQERVRQQQLQFAQELEAINQRIAEMQRQLLNDGSVDLSTLMQGSILDITA